MDSNRWLTEEQRDALRKKEEELREIKYGSRRNKPVTLDYAGRRVVEEDSKMGELCVCVCVCVLFALYKI